MEDPGPTKHTKVLFPFSRHFACLVGKFRVRCGELAEGVGFEPTVGFPTLDFESSALNRTQPPFRNSADNAERATSNIQRSMQLCPPNERLALSISISGIGGFPAVVRRPTVSGFTPRVRLRQNRQSAASSLKSLLHPICSTAASSLHSFSMNILSRFLVLLCLIAVDLISVSTVPAQKLPNTTRLLRFPTTNGSQIVFCYAGELYTVAKDGGTARRLTSGPGYTSFARFSPDGTQITFTSEYDGNREVYVMPAEGGTPT